MLKKHKRLTKKEMKKDPFLIITAQIVEYFRNEWMKIAGTVMGVVVIVSVAVFIVNTKTESEIKDFDRAMSAFNTNQPEAIDIMGKYADKYSGSKYAETIIIKLGNHYYTEKDYQNAEKYYSKYINKYSDNPIYSFNAYCGLGGIYEDQGNFSKAGEIYERYINKHKNSTFLPIMRLNAGKAYYAAGENNSAIENFNVIIDKFADSIEKQEAIFYVEMISNAESGA